MNRVSIPLRLSLCSVGVFALIGLALPFWPVWLTARGVSAEGIGTLVAISYFVRMVAGPGFSIWADHLGDRRLPFVALAGAYLAALGLFWFTHSFLAIVMVTVIVSAVSAPLIPLKESLIMAWATARDFDYGRIRLWGSAAFIVVSMSAGFVITPFGPDAILIGLMALAVLMVVSGYALPGDPRKVEVTTGPRVTWGALGALISDWNFLLFLVGASFVQASHAAYYAFGTLNWQSLGYSDGFIGMMWALGVLAEIVLFAFSGAVYRRVSAPLLIALGAGAAILRWTMTALDPHWALLIPLQCLHAFTFGATHLGVMKYIAQAVPNRLAASAQGIYAATSGGIVMGLVTLGAGPLYGAIGAHAYLPMAGLGLVGLAAAFLLSRRWRAARI